MILPRLLDKNLNEVARLQPSSLLVSLNLTPLSTASMVLSQPQEVEPEIRQFVELFDSAGASLGIFRITQIATDYGNSKTLSLEHAIVTLEDDLTEQDVTLQGTLSTIFAALLACQTEKHWKLGTVEDTAAGYEISVSRTNCLQALQTAAANAGDYYLAFDQSAHPWTVSLLKKPETVDSECRITRNTESVSVSLDTSTLCTRVYSETLSGGYLDADTVGTWGVVAQAIQLDEQDTDEFNADLAQEYLDENKNPAVSVTVSALRLSELTGEPLDSFTLGTLCRIALPDWGVAMDERIITLTYPDLVSDCQRVQLTLANKQDNAASTLAAVANTTRTLVKTVKEQHKHITETEDELLLHAQKITANADSIELNAKEISMKASSAEVSVLGERVSNAEINIDGANAAIQLKADQSEVTELGTRVSNAEINIDGANAAIQLKADQSTVTELGSRVTNAEIKVDGANAAISLKADATVVDEMGERVSAAEISIDGLNSEIALKADKITLNGYVTMSKFEAVESFVDNLSTSTLEVGSLVAEQSVNAEYVTSLIAETDSLILNDKTVSLKSRTYVTDVLLYVATATKTLAKTDGTSETITYVTSVDVNKKTSTIYYLGYD